MNRLSVWLLVAALFAFAVALAVAPPGWHTLLVALHVPAVLATLLLARAIWLVVKGRPLGLQVAGRTVLAGKEALWLPALVLLAWSSLREGGFVRARFCTQDSACNATWIAQPWVERTDQPLLADRVVVAAPDDALGAWVDGALPDHWLGGDWRLHAAITVDGRAPFVPWPLYKSATLRCMVRGVLQLHPTKGSAPVRCSSFELEVDGGFTMAGFASQRDFHEWLGREIGQRLHKNIEGHLERAKKS